jgi:hypothetical protein
VKVLIVYSFVHAALLADLLRNLNHIRSSDAL